MVGSEEKVLFAEPIVLPDGTGEIVRPGAFTQSLRSGRNIRALSEQKEHWVIGRTDDNALLLHEDERGGYVFGITLPNSKTGQEDRWQVGPAIRRSVVTKAADEPLSHKQRRQESDIAPSMQQWAGAVYAPIMLGV